MNKRNIAIVQGGAWGDNINSTLMLKPIKRKYPNCNIDIHTSTLYKSAFTNNPYINKIVSYKASNKSAAINLGLSVPPKIRSTYSLVLSPHPALNPGKWSSSNNPKWGENLIFAWVRALEDNDIEYTNLETIMRLTDQEVNNAKKVINNIQGKRALMEIDGESGQSPFNPQWTKSVGDFLCSIGYNLLISHKSKRRDIAELESRNKGKVHWVGKLSIRECAELFNSSDLFISVSSGLSNACNTSWCKNDIKWFEVVNSKTCSSSAIRESGKHFYHSSNLEGFMSLLKKNA